MLQARFRAFPWKAAAYTSICFVIDVFCLFIYLYDVVVLLLLFLFFCLLFYCTFFLKHISLPVYVKWNYMNILCTLQINVIKLFLHNVILLRGIILEKALQSHMISLKFTFTYFFKQIINFYEQSILYFMGKQKIKYVETRRDPLPNFPFLSFAHCFLVFGYLGSYAAILKVPW
jgi:hypothetical protein